MPTFVSVISAIQKFISLCETDKSPYEVIAPKYIIDWLEKNIPRECEIISHDIIIVYGNGKQKQVEFQIASDGDCMLEHIPDNRFYIARESPSDTWIFGNSPIENISYIRYDIIHSTPFMTEYTPDVGITCNTCMREKEELLVVPTRLDDEIFSELERIAEKYGMENIRKLIDESQRIRNKNSISLYKCCYCNYWNCFNCVERLMKDLTFVCPQCRRTSVKLQKHDITRIENQKDLLEFVNKIIDKYSSYICGPIPEFDREPNIQIGNKGNHAVVTDVLILQTEKESFSNVIRTMLPLEKRLFIITI